MICLRTTQQQFYRRLGSLEGEAVVSSRLTSWSTAGGSLLRPIVQRRIAERNVHARVSLSVYWRQPAVAVGYATFHDVEE
jgi:hypothetical protein